MRHAPLSGRYELEEIVGTGGMSVVYRAWDMKYDCEVAVKMLRPEYACDEEFLRRFNSEAQAASQMSHKNIVHMFDVGKDEITPYIVMEYVHGSTLKDIIIQKALDNDFRKIIRITLKILAAVDHAHRNGIVHRDIKPQNILVDDEGTVKVADFGIARLVNAAGATRNGNIIGTVHYFSPEQANGGVADEKSDLYSVGVVLYEMVTGQVPFDGESAMSVALMHIRDNPRPPSEINPQVSKGLEEVILKAMSKEPSKRYQDAVEFAVDLRRAMKMPMGGFVRKPASELRKQNEKKPSRWYITALIALLATVVTAAGGIFGWKMYEKLQTRVKVPGVLLADIEDAAAQIEECGLQVQILQAYHDEIIAGIVFDQSPSEGMLLFPGEEVKLMVSKGKDAVEVPNVSGIGLTRSDAESILTDAGLASGGIVLEISSEKVGTVVRQEPDAGEMVRPFSEVVLYVSGECGEVPDLSGLTAEEAVSALASRGFQIGEVQERFDETEPGRVIDQSLPFGTQALIGEQIDVVISQEVPQGYFAETSVMIVVEKDGDEVLCMLTDGSGVMHEVYREHAEAGTQTINLSLDSYTPGEHTLSVYIWDELVTEKKIMFE